MCDSIVFQYLGSADGLSMGYHIISVVELPVHVFSTYCILCKTPQKMASVKMSMIFLHFWSVLLDFYLTSLTIPYETYPVMAGFPLGFLNYFKIPTSVQAYLGISLIAVVGVAVIGFFENRYYHLIVSVRSVTPTARRGRILYMLFNYFFAFTATSPAFLNIPDQDVGKQYIRDNFECFDFDVLNHPEFIILAVDNTIFVICFSVSLVAILIQSFFFITHIILYLIDVRTISPRTYRMQKSFLQAMSFQIFIPLCIVGIPVAYIIIASIVNYHNQAYNNIMMMSLSLHGFSSSIVMVIVHKPYRVVLVGVYHKALCHVKSIQSISGLKPADSYNILRNVPSALSVQIV